MDKYLITNKSHTSVYSDDTKWALAMHVLNAFYDEKERRISYFYAGRNRIDGMSFNEEDSKDRVWLNKEIKKRYVELAENCGWIFYKIDNPFV